MKRYAFACLTLMLTALSVAAQGRRYEMNMGQYNNVRVLNDIDVDIVCNSDSAGKVVFFAEDKAVPRIILSNNSKGKLTVQTDNTIDVIQLPKVTVYVNELAQVENAGDSTVTIFAKSDKVYELKIKTTNNGRIVANDIEASLVELAVSTGRGHIIAAGKCQTLKVSNVGTGEINAYGLEATDVKAHILGTGSVSCLVNGGSLTLRGTGTGKLYYKGKPAEVNVKKLGSLKAIPVDEK
ncbi:MAG: GIN domain-containing protein [Muribaculaceae bacterium]